MISAIYNGKLNYKNISPKKLLLRVQLMATYRAVM